MIELRSGSEEKPHVFIHALSGMVWHYKSLINALDVKQVCYGLQSCGIDDTRMPYDNVASIAAYHKQQLLKKHTADEFVLIGWSFGGLVGLELAHQLVLSGYEVDLYIIDCLAFNCERRDEEISVVNQMTQFIDVLIDKHKSGELGVKTEIEGISPSERLMWLVEYIRDNSEIKNVELIVRLYQVYIANLRAQFRYVPPVYEGDKTTIIWGENLKGGREHSKDRWNKALPNGHDKICLPESHYDILTGQSLQRLSRIISEKSN